MVQFYQPVSDSSSAVHGSFRLISSSCNSVAGSVGSVVRFVRLVCRFAVADQYSQTQITKYVSRLLGFFTNASEEYIV